MAQTTGATGAGATGGTSGPWGPGSPAGPTGPAGPARTRWPALATAGALVFAAGTGLGWLITDDSQGGGAPGTPGMVRPGAEPASFGSPMERLWHTPDIGKSGDGDDPYIGNTWVYKDVLVRVDSMGVRGLDTETGDQRWEAQLPPGADKFCGMPEVRPGASTAVTLYADGSTERCDQLVAIGLSDGEVLWTADATPPGGGGGDDFEYEDEQVFPEPVVTEKVIALMWNTDDNRVIRRYDMSNGEQLPELRPTAQGECWGASTYMPGVDHLLLWSRCGDGDHEDRKLWEVSAFDPEGDPEDAPLWTTRVNVSPEETYGALSDEPLVLYGENGVSTFTPQASTAKGAGKPEWRVREEGSINNAVVSRTTGDRYLMVKLTRRDESYLLGFDLASGERLWDRQIFNQNLVGVEGDHMLLADEPPDNRSQLDLSGDPPPKDRMRVSWVAFEDGALVTEGTIPKNYGVDGLDSEYVYPLPAWDEQRVYLSLVGETGDGDIARTVAFDRNN